MCSDFFVIFDYIINQLLLSYINIYIYVSIIMGTLSGATENKIMTNTWLDSRISPVFHSDIFLTFNITWKITNGTYTTTKTCTYKAVKKQSDKIIYVLTQSTHVAGITDASLNPSLLGHNQLVSVARVLNKIYLPFINSNISISSLTSLAVFSITSTNANLGNISTGDYTLSQLQSALKSVGTTITVNNPNSVVSIEKTLYHITNAGVEYGGNCVNYRGVPPSSISNYINRTPEEDNSSKRAITKNDFFNIFRNTKILDYRCVREDIDMFNNITFYPTIGTVYTNYIEPESSSNTLTKYINISKTNRYTIIPPTLTGLEYWNGITGNYDNSFTQYLTLYKANEDIENIENLLIDVNNSVRKLNANDIAFNYENVTNKTDPVFTSSGFFGKYTFDNTNDMYGATFGMSSVTTVPLKLAKNRKVYPGDIYNRNPYITPRIAYEMDQSIPVNIYNVDYLSFSDAMQHYQHPTINKYLNSSVESDNNGKAIVPVIYIPSTIRLYRSGTCSYTLNTSGTYPTATVSFSSGLSFFVYRYAYGNRGSMSSNTTPYQVKTSEIYDLDAFMSQLNSGAVIGGNIKFTQTFKTSSGTTTRPGELPFTPTVTFTASTDRSGYLIITANANVITTGGLYIGSNPITTVINSISVTMDSTGIDGFLLGTITSYERTTDITQTLWSYVNTSTGSGTSSASTLSLDDDGIDTADFVIGSFDEFDE